MFPGTGIVSRKVVTDMIMNKMFWGTFIPDKGIQNKMGFIIQWMKFPCTTRKQMVYRNL